MLMDDMEDLQPFIETFLEVCRRIESKGFVAATDGNVSARLPNGNVLTTPTAMNKAFVTAGDLVELDLNGFRVAGRRNPSSEIDMHLFIYGSRPDVRAVVHCHPVYATAFATARIPLSECLFPEVIVGMGAVPLAPYATPSTREVRDSIAPFVGKADAILLANHGAVTCGSDLWDAYFKMEKLEHAARVQYLARTLGGEKPLTAEEVSKLAAVAGPSYGKDLAGKPLCKPAGEQGTPDLSDPRIAAIVQEVQRRLQKYQIE